MNSINSFSDLLAQGQITEALQLRLEAIEASARHYRQDLEAAKVSSAALGVVGLLLSANPLVAVIAGCGLAGYGWTILRDYQNTKRLCLLPLVRKGTGELLTGIGLAATNDQAEADDPLLGVIGYVEPELAHEYELVMVAEAQLTGYLAQLPGESRLNAFRHILRHTRLRNSLKLPPLQDVAVAIASGSVSSSSQSLPPQKESAQDEVPVIDVAAKPVDEPTQNVPTPTGSGSTPYDEFKEPFVGHAPRQIPVNPLAAPLDPPHVNVTSGQDGLEILQALATTRRSTLLIGDTGAGKSVSQSYILNKLFELHPDAQVFVLSQKADSFCGLAQKGRVTLFDSTEPGPALILINNIWSVYDTRRRLPESERPGLSPVRLILADWLSINQSLEELKNDELVKASRYLSKLADIIYNGRELNVCLLVDLQSYNLAAVGLKADRNSRKNFNLIGLGNYSIDELGMVNESYGVLTNLIGDRYIVAEESERTALTATFKNLQPISKANHRPIIFSGLSPARLALLPDLRKYKNSTVATAKQPEELGDIRQRLELLLDSSTAEPSPPSDSSADQDSELPKRTPEPLNQPIDEDCTDLDNGSRFSSESSSERFTPLNLSKEQVQALVQSLNPELNQTQIIERLWQVKKGGSAAWKQARQQFRELTGE
jgi:hypothetical protein